MGYIKLLSDSYFLSHHCICIYILTLLITDFQLWLYEMLVSSNLDFKRAVICGYSVYSDYIHTITLWYSHVNIIFHIYFYYFCIVSLTSWNLQMMPKQNNCRFCEVLPRLHTPFHGYGKQKVKSLFITIFHIN